MYLISKPEEKEEGDPENLVLEGILQDEIYTFENEQEVEIPISQKIEKEKLPSIIVKPIEIAKGIIPDELTFGGIVFALFFAFLSDITRLNFMLWQNNSWRSSTNGLIAAIGWIWGISFVFKMVAKKEGMGMGDVKLFGFIGAILGVKLGLLSIFFSAFIGLIVTIINKVGRRQPFPFGPFLAIGTYLSLFLGERILSLLY